jgi:hypothetical protein
VRQCCERFGISARAWQLAVEAGLIPPPAKARMLASEKRDLIDRLFREGYSQAMIAAELGMSKATVAYHARRVGLPVRDDFGVATTGRRSSARMTRVCLPAIARGDSVSRRRDGARPWPAGTSFPGRAECL